MINDKWYHKAIKQFEKQYQDAKPHDLKEFDGLVEVKGYCDICKQKKVILYDRVSKRSFCDDCVDFGTQYYPFEMDVMWDVAHQLLYYFKKLADDVDKNPHIVTPDELEVKEMHFFNVATNLTMGPFMVGYENDPYNFYLKGETVEDEPLISCRILDTKGHVLLSMERDKISHGKGISIEKNVDKLVIFNEKGQTIIKIETRDERKMRITYIEGPFYDKNGRLAARGDERGLFINCQSRM